MPLSWNEIKDRALKFSKEWADETSEDAEAKSFWDGFFNIFGVSRRRVATFEQKVKKIDGKDGYIDLLWRGIILIEHKSRGKDLARAYQQAKDYFPGLKDADLPRYILVSDFARFRLHDLEEGTQQEFALKDLYKHVKLFGFIAGYQRHTYKEQDPVNIKAAERMGKLHDRLKAIGYEGHSLEVYLVRLLFCLFAEDTSIFERRQFQDYIELKTAEDGTDLGGHLDQIFYVLNTPPEKRLKALDETLVAFPYVNGKLFEERLPPAAFDADMRQTLLDCCALDWSRISPAIFGSLFQSVMDAKARRNLGAHYTSEGNILKLIKPLFLDELRREFDSVKASPKKLAEFHQKLAKLKFLDPACGCGNFLVIAYRELRLLELDILRALYDSGQTFLDVAAIVWLDVDQFYGIEYEEFPAQIAQVALWLMDHQMNMLISEEFGNYFARLPLKKSASIVHGNALRLDWQEVVKPEELAYILGNPPFVGAMVMDDVQRADMALVFEGFKGAGVLDYVAAWYLKAAQFIQGTAIRAALVSTNSITQGEQVGILWGELLNRFHVKIHFAHRTFKWSNEARGKAAVHCVIIGFGLQDIAEKTIFDYDSPQADAHAIKAKNINPYLVDADDVLLANRNAPLCQVPGMRFGSMPRDGGNLLFTESEREDFLTAEPDAEKWIRPYIGSHEFINGEQRWCLWLKGASPKDLRALPKVLERIEAVRQFRLKSKAASTRKFAETPSVFCQIAQPDTPYLLVPGVSSERRRYIPIGFMEPTSIANNLVFVVPNATLYHLGILSSAMHMAWVRYTCGRLKSDYRYSKDIVYNNFPWPQDPTPKQVQAVEKAAQAVLDARAQFPGSSLADLYDPLTMPPALVKAHQQLDRAVDACYRSQPFTDDAKRVEYLFGLYETYTSLLAAKKKGKATRANPERKAKG